MESRHRIHLAVTDSRGRLVFSAGDPALVTFFRSAAKPFQLLPLVDSGAVEALGLTPLHLAVAAGSHSAEARHLETVQDFLRRAGCTEADLECGPHEPMDPAAARALSRRETAPAPIHNNCSGKHAAMLTLARHRGWPLAGYRRPDHPVQEAMLQEVARWTGRSPNSIRLGGDGCGVVTFALPLQAMAQAYSALGRAAHRGEGAARQVVGAMMDEPFQVAGTGRLCTLLMETAPGKVFVKVGAEGVYGAGIPSEGLGIVLKVEDGGRRAAEPALLRVLEHLGVPGLGHSPLLQPFRAPVVRDTLGDEVGRLEVEMPPIPLRDREGVQGG